MVNVKKFVSAKYLSAKNIGDSRGKTFVIDTAFSDIINEEEKLIIRLNGVDSPMPLNQTNLSILVEAYGEDTDEWINNKVTLNIVKVQYAGNLVDGIQLSPIKVKK
jgi:hypothetical protein